MAHETTTPPAVKTVRVPVDLHARLKAQAALARMTIEAYLEQLVREHLEDAA